MDGQAQAIRELLDRVRGRWRRTTLFRAIVRAGLAVAAILAVALLLSLLLALAGRSSSSAVLPAALALLGLTTIILTIGAAVWALWPARAVPSDARVARYIEEREPDLDDRLASAVEVLNGAPGGQMPALAAPMVADADRRAARVDPSTIVRGETLRRAALQAAGAAVLAFAVAFAGRGVARQSFDAAALALFPSRVTLEVTPGSARVPAGAPLVIAARLVGNTTPVAAEVLREDTPDSEDWRPLTMETDASGGFVLSLDGVTTPFRYRVVAGAIGSEIYEVGVLHAPRVTRIDVEYRYPGSLGLAPHVEEDGGDIFAPAGTEAHLRVHVDQSATGSMVLADGAPLQLAAAGGRPGPVLEGVLTVSGDSWYRIALTSAEGLTNRGDTEYFIRAMEDRPPEVRVTRPARDRSVTSLEEVDIDAEAEDDFGIGRLELVYAVRGGAEKVVPMSVPSRATSVSGSQTLYLEDLGVQPGDFVSYYVRARDVPRGKRASETRSDIFFLEVKPFEQEFSLAQSQSMGGGGSNQNLDDLVTAQKEIIVATWKLDRRTQAAGGAGSSDDIRAVAKAEAELKTRVEATSSSFRASTMRDPRRRPTPQGRGGQPPPAPEPRAGQARPEEDAMTAASQAMGVAVASLEKLKTGEALPPEMEALNHLLKAQADVKERQVTRQQAGSGGGANRATQDMSSLFDRELQRQQETNYETPTTTERRGDNEASSTLDKIKELARRQDELNARQQALTRAGASAEEIKRELERLTREQSELRQRAEELAREMSRASQDSQAGQQTQTGQSGQTGQTGQAGQAGRGGQPGQGQPRPGNAPGRAGGQGDAQQGQQQAQLRAASEEMRNAASGLQRQDAAEAASRGARAAARLRDLERSLQQGAPDEQRRALGDLQMEARQLADAERQIGRELESGRGDGDAERRLAGEQDRLADRVRRLEDGLERQAGEPGANGAQRDSAARAGTESAARAAGEAAREIERQRLATRMEQAAAGLRDGASNNTASSRTDRDDIARALDRVAERLASTTAGGDDDSRRMTDQLARAQELRERIETLTREMERLDREATRQGQAGQAGQAGREGQAGRAGQTGQAGREGQVGRAGQDADAGRSGQPGRSGRSGDTGQSGQPGQGGQPGQIGQPGQSGQGAAGGSEFAELRREYGQQLEQTRQLLEQLQREDVRVGQGGPGFTFEGQGMVLSAPGTEAFKQDFSRWSELARQATQALDRASSSLSQALEARRSRDRLASGVDDRAPAGYKQQVDNYFKALATGR